LHNLLYLITFTVN